MRARRSAAARCARPACPACCGRRCRASFSTRDASGVLRSWSKKNLASARRARNTRSLPWTIAAGSLRLDVADQQEAVPELAVAIGQREVFLVLLHRQDQAFLRHGEERAIERAGVDGRPFDQRGDFVEQRVGHDDQRVLGRLLQRGDDLRAACGERRQAPCPRPPGSARRPRRSRCSMSPRLEKAVPAGDAVRRRGRARIPARRRRRAAPAADAPGGTNLTVEPSGR